MLLGAVTTDPLINILLAAGSTWAAHSSVTVVLLVMAFAAQAVVPPHAAFALVLGANLGTATLECAAQVNPALEQNVDQRIGRDRTEQHAQARHVPRRG